MAAGDFASLQLNLANLAGRSLAADLDDDLALCKQVINEAYFECYAPVDGVRPRWARLPIGAFLFGPRSADLTMVQGSVTFTGALPGTAALYLGSVVKIGSGFYNLTSATTLAQPFMEASGVYPSTVYGNAVVLAAGVLEVISVESFGWGPLSPSSKEEILLHRSNFRGDFHAEAGEGHSFSHNLPGGTAWQIGTPKFYYVDSDLLTATGDVGKRLCVYPIPGENTGLEITAQMTAATLTADGDMPKLPSGGIEQILLPIARYIWGVTYKKYTGNNLGELTDRANQARAQLRSMNVTQRRTNTVMRPRFN